MSDDVKIKVAEILKDLENLKLRCQEVWTEHKESFKEMTTELKSLHDNVADLYNQVENIKDDSDHDYKSVSSKVDVISQGLENIKNRGCNRAIEFHNFSVVGKMANEISSSKLLPVLKVIIWALVLVLAAKGLIPSEWLKW